MGMEADPRDQRIQELEAENARLRQLIEALQDRVEALERAAARQAAPFRRRDQDRKPPDQHQPPGRKPGHPPAQRPEPPHIDDQVEMRLEGCPHCGGPVTEVHPCEQIIEDLPPVRPRVTRLITYTGRCRRCGEVRSTHPMQVSTATGAAKVHLGARALGLAAVLKHLGLPMRRTCRVLQTLSGLRITPGGLTQALERMARKAQPAFDQLCADLRRQPGVWVDETSWWVGGPGWWLWTFTTPDLTVYHVDARRGRDVVLEMLGQDFPGVLTSDCLASYENLPYRMHKCYAHHLKAIAQAFDQQPSDYLIELRGLLLAAMMLQAHRGDLSPPQWTQKRQALENRADELLLRCSPPAGAAKVAERIRKRRRWLFTFLDDPRLEATNNRAERSLRPAVIARKVSCGNKTPRGQRTWQTLASLAATAAQRGQDLLEILCPHLLLPNPFPAR
jgi:hypothetical protein